MRYSELAKLYEKLESTSKRLEKTFLISEFLKQTPAEDIEEAVLLLQGKVFPNWDEQKIGVASRLVLKAMVLASGLKLSKIEDDWKKTGDLGLTAQNIIKVKSQATLFTKKITTLKVFENIKKLAIIEGSGTVDKKVNIISELLTSASPIEAKYIVRTVLEDLRIGVGDGTIRDAIVWAFEYKKIKYLPEENKIEIEDPEYHKSAVERVQHAYDLINDFGVIAKKSKKGENLEKIRVEIFRPIKVMLFQKEENIEKAFDRVGKPAAFEYKYDGFRMQIHKKSDKILIFTRRLENVTNQFSEIIPLIRDIKAESFILDCEAVGYDASTGRYLAFQKISQRIKRKYNIEDMAKKFPIEINVFDILYYNGKELIKENFKKRREIIEKIIPNKPKKIICANQIITGKYDIAEKFYKNALKLKFEGVMAKKLDAPYKPGSRVGYGVKLKSVMEGLDLVIVAAEWGEGKRAKWLSSFTVACIDEDGNFKEIGKVGTGIKELAGSGVSFDELTESLKPLIISESGKSVFVKPKIVVEINYEEIQKSTKYSSGYALRFPRFIRLREDKAVNEISSLETVKKLYGGQK